MSNPQNTAAPQGLTAGQVQERMTWMAERLRTLRAELAKVVVGQDEVIEGVVLGMLGGGHVLLEGVPGLGKTLLVRTLAQALHLDFSRVQFTPDLKASDVLGTQVLMEDERGGRQLVFQPGPIFTHVLLADEINRTTPRTQSALLEAMAEGRVTVDGHTHALPQPHLVLATQNPREFHGTFPLPESQLDRFLLRISVGYLQADAEMDLIARHGAPEQMPEAAANATIVQDLVAAAEKVHVAREVLGYLHALVQATRQNRALELGLSTRAAIGYYRAVQARALVQGRTFVTPDDIQQLFLPVANHRVVLSGLTGPSGERTAVEAVLHQVLESVPAPA